MALLAGAWRWRLEPSIDKRGQFSPTMQRQALSIAIAAAGALVFEWVLFGLLTHEWTWLWKQVRLLNGDDTNSLVSPAIAVLTPLIALVTAVFAYRRSTIALAESQRADVAAFQQRYIDAARLLADPSAPVRVAGAIAMGSLARDWAENRQECLDVLCGYMRVRPDVDLLETTDKGATWHRGEDAVRSEIVDQLRRVLTAVEVPPPRNRLIRVNLTGAWFPPGISLEGAHIGGDAIFLDAVFTGSAVLSHCHFGGVANFVRARFEGYATFERAVFGGRAAFHKAHFAVDSEFSHSTFGDAASFTGATFMRDTWFDACTFQGRAAFNDVKFGESSSFHETRFQPRQLLSRLAHSSALPLAPGLVVRSFDRDDIAEWSIGAERSEPPN